MTCGIHGDGTGICFSDRAEHGYHPKFIEIFQAEALWIPGVSLLDGIAYDYAEKNKYLKSVHNFENDILVASTNIAKRYSSGKNHIAGTTDLALDIFDST